MVFWSFGAPGFSVWGLRFRVLGGVRCFRLPGVGLRIEAFVRVP